MSNRLEYGRLYHQKIASERTDRIQHRREEEKLDKYAAAMQLDPVQTPEEILLAKEDANLLVKHLDNLPWPRVILAIKMYHGIGVEPHTLEEIGELFDVTRERVRQIIHKGIRALKHPYRLRQFRPELYEKERARLDAAAKQAIADDMARVEREMREARERQADRWHERHEDIIERARQRVEMSERLKVIQLEQHRKNVQLLAERDYEEAHYINSLWDKELLRREIKQEIEIEMMWKRKERDERPQRRDWLYVASDRKQA